MRKVSVVLTLCLSIGLFTGLSHAQMGRIHDLSEPGSFLMFPLIDNINYRTIVNIANLSGVSVWLECVQVTHGVTNDTIDEKQDFTIWLSPRQKLWWNTSQSKSITFIWGGQRIISGLPSLKGRKGYMFCWAINNKFQQYEIPFNYLKGDATVFGGKRAFSYQAIPAQAREIDGVPRRLLLDGFEYTAGVDTVYFEGFSDGAFGVVKGTLVVAEPNIDLVLSRQPEFDINLECYSENESKSSRDLHYMDFEQYDQASGLQLSVRDIVTDAFQCEAVAGPWRDPYDGSVISSRSSLYAVFYQTAGNLMWGGNVWYPVNGGRIARSCIRLGGADCPKF